MASPEKYGQEDFGPTEWDELLSYGKEHPFGGNTSSGEDSEGAKEREPLEVIRQKHIDWLAGKYRPTIEELDYFEEDEGFYDCDEFNAYKKRETDEVAKERADIYAPSDERVRYTVEPFIESVRSDFGRLLKIGSELERGESIERSISEMVLFFAEKFEVDDVPGLQLTNEGSVSGSYSHYYNSIKVKYDKTESVAELIDTISHEIWHAHQHNYENGEYEINFNYYYRSSMDYDAYRNQLVEKEAFVVGDTIGDLYRKADLNAHPEKIADLRKKYYEWLNKKYEPSKTEDGIDYEYLILAHEEYGAEGFFRKLFRKERK